MCFPSILSNPITPLSNQNDDKNKPNNKTEKTPEKPLGLQNQDNKNQTRNVFFDTMGELFNFPNLMKAETNTKTNENKTEKDKECSIPYKIDDQGDTNACGTTSLASVLNYYNEDKSKNIDHWKIDKSIRATGLGDGGMFTAPSSIVSYAKKNGFNAGLQKNTTIEDLAKRIDKGVPSMVLIDTTPEDKNDAAFHWMVVTGYTKDDKNQINKLKMADPSGGYVSDVDVADFKKQWGNLKAGFNYNDKIKMSVGTGYNNLSVVIVPKNGDLTTPEGKKIKVSEVKVPNDRDSIQGVIADKIGKGAVLVDKTIQKVKEVKTAVVNGITTAKNYATHVAHVVKEKLNTAIDETKKFVSSTAKKIEAKVAPVINKVKETVAPVVAKVNTAISTVKSYTVSAVSTAKEYVGGAISNAKSYFSSASSSISNLFSF
ncbi:MAG: C39 family peptidase [Candidatus Sericytochromatia bacterium]